MLQFLYNHDDEIAHWVHEKLKAPKFQRPYTAIGIIKNDRVAGGMVFNDYTGANIEVTIYCPGCITRSSIRTCFTYAFEDLKCVRLTAKTKRGNRIMCKMLPRLGFTYEATLKNYYGYGKLDDAIVFRLEHAIASRWM